MVLWVQEHVRFANVMAVIAVVFAMAGGAYAAGIVKITSLRQISPKVVKQLKGARGPAGTPGLAGPQGPVGKDGANGVNGKDGLPGKDGVSVTSSAEPAGEHCKDGGSKFVATSGTTYACNGQTGFTETLPKGKTLAGDWRIEATVPAANFSLSTSVSFGIPLKAAPVAHFIRPSGMEPVWNSGEEKEEEVESSACTGTPSEPTATEGNLCIYAAHEENTRQNLFGKVFPVILPGTEGLNFFASQHAADNFGFSLVTLAKGEGQVQVMGTWAVTAG
jgi:hypothetical protein